MVNSTTVTGVTPAHAAVVVDVVITTPAGGATLPNSYTFVTVAVGQPSGGGTIACLKGGLNDLIAATVDNPASPIPWGGLNIAVGAQSDTDGASNTAAIVACLTGPGGAGGCPMNINVNTYAAGICSTYQVDSQGHSPCQAGNTCYNDWFLPASPDDLFGIPADSTSQLDCLWFNRSVIGGFTGVTPYWSSTELTGAPNVAWVEYFSNGQLTVLGRDVNNSVRCVRSFIP